jgi:hypothetical protein
MTPNKDRQHHVCLHLNAFGWVAYNPSRADEPAPEIIIGPPVHMRLRRSSNRIVVTPDGTVLDLPDFLARQARSGDNAKTRESA